MGASIIKFPFFLFCFLCLPYFIESSVGNCLNNQCSKEGPGIAFPFRLKGRQPERCGYPGFDLTCDNMNRTIIELPFSGRFLVKDIKYGGTYNEILLHDPDDCLPRRLLNPLNLSVPVDYISDVYREYPWFPYESVLKVTWNWKKPWCKQNCNKDSSFPTFEEGHKFPDVPTAGKTFLMVIGIIIPTVIVAAVCYSVSRIKGFCFGAGNEVTNSLASQLVTITTGLDGSAIQSFPTVVLGDSGRLPNPDSNTCAICLSEYQPKETIKTLPACNHLFHAYCIDSWVHLNSTCPVCRISLIP
ncbi:putative RING-H2 finger protein ATL21A isoform X2 [Papaver somniferum]|uniref:putative RING-H2 finger protein ATL21A isoform X2 n=1 Tax=Papaver somniferum TaxID=3469 RepID=UPI000E704988|nr:putative RING-H2 finger protein ATL21A isoform X2 [Papaver somniferum]